MTPAFLAALASDKLAIPELRAKIDLQILDTIVHSVPRLDDRGGWDVRFGRELNATDDRAHFHTGRSGMPVLEGKHIEPFRAHPEHSTAQDLESTGGRPARCSVDVLTPAARLSRRRKHDQSPLVDFGHSARARRHDPLVVLSENAASRRRPGLSMRHAEQLRGELPRASDHDDAPGLDNRGSAACTETSARFRRFRRDRGVVPSPAPRYSGVAYTRIQALAARCYRLSEREFEHVLGTFPLVDRSDRIAVLDEFRRSG